MQNDIYYRIENEEKDILFETDVANEAIKYFCDNYLMFDLKVFELYGFYTEEDEDGIVVECYSDEEMILESMDILEYEDPVEKAYTAFNL